MAASRNLMASSQSHGQVGLRNPALCVSRCRMVMESMLPNCIVHLTQFGHIADGRIIQRQLASIAQLQNCDGRHGFGDRSPVVCSCVIDSLMSIGTSLAECDGLRWSLSAHKCESAAYNSMLLQNRLELRTECVERGVRRDCLGTGLLLQAGGRRSRRSELRGNTGCRVGMGQS